MTVSHGCSTEPHHPTKSGSVLVIGHPGHELRVLGWVSKARPMVVVITDGGGFHDDPRIALTRQLLVEAGASASSLFGFVSDKAFYAALIGGDTAFFEDMAERVAAVLVEAATERVVGDAIEGYSPTHDVCRLLIDRAVAIAERCLGRPIENLSFLLTGEPGTEAVSPGGRSISLDPDAAERKLERVLAYARAAGGTLLSEVEDMLATHGGQALAVERLDAPRTDEALATFASAKPFYETYGEGKVAAGQYRDVIRFRQHVAPLAAYLRGRN